MNTAPWDLRAFARIARRKNIFAALEEQTKAQAKAYRLAGREVVSYAVAQFVRRAQELTIRTVGRAPGRGMAPTVKSAKSDYADYLERWIKKGRFRKWGDAPGGGRGHFRRNTAMRWFLENRLAKKEIAAYFRRAKTLQGRFAAGWNAAATAKKVPVPAWVKRHGASFGRALQTMVSGGVYSESVFFEASSKGGGHGNIDFVVETANRSVQKELAAAATKFLAANVRRHAKKLSKS